MNKPKDVQVLPIATDTVILRSRTWDRLKFEIEYALKKGTTANSYLIRGDKFALIDPPGESFTDIFLLALANVQTQLSGFEPSLLGKMARFFQGKSFTQTFEPTDIDYVILGHVNPNRGVTLKALLKIAPQITFVTSNPGAIALREIISDQDLKIQVVKGEDTLNLGNGHRLEFITTPNPRFPDQLCTYDPKTQILFSDKLFGAHICDDPIFDEDWTRYSEDRRYYFDCIMAPYARQVSNALEKLDTKPAQLYATGHGPLVRYGITELTTDYQNWLTEQQEQEETVTLIYASAYGNTATIGEAIARGITKAGVAVESINAEVTEPDEIKAALKKSAGFIMGSPTLGGHAPTPIQTALGIVLANAEKTQLAGVFGSFGWSGEAIDLLESKFKNAGYPFGFETLRIKFKPDEITLQTCEEAGIDFAQAIKKAKKKAQKASRTTKQLTQVDRTTQALGRVVGSLCIVTSKQGDLSGGMLASWVSQATFNPPGLTVAVAKERAIESLLHSGNTFVLNILQDGNHLKTMKHFLKPFAPGEDRFIGIETDETEDGNPIIQEAIAYVECCVENRLECGDHWVIYAVAHQGKLLQQEGVTAVHHRKSGDHY